ncbi:MAG: hypothetical protein AAGK74_05750 [Chloroflexota bacterium]
MTTTLITGATSGIGLELAKIYASSMKLHRKYVRALHIKLILLQKDVKPR